VCKSIPDNGNLSCLNFRGTWEHAWGTRPIAYMYDHCIFAMFVLRSRNRLLGFPGFEESCDYSPADGHLYIRESKFRLGLGKARVYTQQNIASQWNFFLSSYSLLPHIWEIELSKGVLTHLIGTLH